MNYYDARQHKAGGWHYTVVNGTGTFAVGYCCRHEPHATEAEARECFRQFLLDNRHEDQMSDAQHHCEAEGCEEWTFGLLFDGGPMGGEMHVLCDAHRNRETLDALTPTPGQITASG